jgi:glucose-1-phosphate thymidylyltransferase
MSKMKAIILAGGSGTRLYPVTKVMSKQLMPVYDKPMIYYPLSLVMRSRLKDILIISTPQDTPNIQHLLGDGSQLGVNISYKVQPHPGGIAQAFVLGAEFIGNDPVCLVLGDNIFHGRGLNKLIDSAAQVDSGATVLAYHVKDPERYGVVTFDDDMKALSIEEKPKNPQSNWAITGIYFYDNDVVNITKNLKPSARGELEITDVNKEYLRRGQLKVEIMGRGVAWLDTGTPQSLLEAANFIKIVEDRQGLRIGCIEEVAFSRKFINADQLRALADSYGNNDYAKYLKHIADAGKSWLA